jgi:hypothetical protein
MIYMLPTEEARNLFSSGESRKRAVDPCGRYVLHKHHESSLSDTVSGRLRRRPLFLDDPGC